MLSKRKILVIVTCMILLTGNILGLIEDSKGIGQWNLNKTFSLFPSYYSFSFAKLYELEGMWRFSPRPYYSSLAFIDWVLLISALVTGIFLYKTKGGRLFLLGFFALVILFSVIITVREYRLFGFIYRDYLPSGWDWGIRRSWYWECLAPRAIYFVLSGLSFYLILMMKKPLRAVSQEGK